MNFDRKWIALLIALVALIHSAIGIEVIINGGEGGESSSVHTKIDVADEAAVSSTAIIADAYIYPAISIRGRTKTFTQTHQVSDRSGKTAKVYVQVINAPKDLKYSSKVLPKKGSIRTTQPWVSAEQWLTVSKADYIKCTESASYGALSADVGIEETKGALPGDYVSLIGYYGKAYASATDVYATQTATNGLGDSIKLYGNANNGNGALSIETILDSIWGENAKFQTLDTSSSAGATTQVIQSAHIHGAFSSTATVPGPITKTRNSNYGTEYDLNMKATTGSMPMGVLGYYINPNMATEGMGAIQGAVNAAESGDTINAAAGVYNENVAVDKSLTIKGAGASNTEVNGDVNSDGIGDNSVFRIGTSNSDIDVTLSGMNIIGGLGALGGNIGGGIHNKGRVTIKDCTISENTANNGGGINNFGRMMITESTISRNSANVGGAIYNSGTMVVKDCTISENKANQGGGISNFGAIEVINSIISGNKAETKSGGGIENFGTAIVTGCDILDNSAYSNGGGINSRDLSGYPAAKLTVKDSIVSGNTASVGGGICNGGIGAGGTSTITNSTISGNSRSGIANWGTTTVTDSTIIGNSAIHGGGIENYGVLYANDSTISDNSASTSGGGIYSSSAGALIVNDCIVSQNSAANSGGGIHNNGLAAVTNSTISENSATSISTGGSGAGIDSSGTLTVTNCAISRNSASTVGSIGGGIRVDNGIATITNSTISENSAKYGGGIGIRGTAIIANCTISENSAIADGGGTWTSGSSTIKGGKIYANHADSNRDGIGKGGGIFWDAGSLVIQDINGVPVAPPYSSIVYGNFAGDIPNDIAS